MPNPGATLDEYLHVWAQGTDKRAAVGNAVAALAAACADIAAVVRLGGLATNLGQTTRSGGADSEQKAIDLIANGIVVEAMKQAPVAALASEELTEALSFDADAPLLVATDPLDGSSNIDANVSVGTIFSILPARRALSPTAAFLQPGHNQLAAGFAVYGPQTTLALTLGAGTRVFTFDTGRKQFILTSASVLVPPTSNEYAINSSNARHWDETVRLYIHDCENGADGPRGHDFNMRWTGSPVSDLYRILTRGGIYLYPGDKRKGFQDGRLRLIYEANPIAFIFEDAGGRATTGTRRVLDVHPETLHQKTPLIAGSRLEVDHFLRIASGIDSKGERSPLFARRGLLRAW